MTLSHPRGGEGCDFVAVCVVQIGSGVVGVAAVVVVVVLVVVGCCCCYYCCC